VPTTSRSSPSAARSRSESSVARSRSESSAAHGSLEESDVGEEDEGHTHDEINISQIPDAPEPTQQRRDFNFKPRKPREYSENDMYTPDAYVRKPRKDPVIEAEGDSEEEDEELPHLGRRRREAVTKKEVGKGKRGKGRK
jgi:hypothetical protein